MAFEKAAEDVTEIVEKFYDRYMKINDEETGIIQEYIKTMTSEDISLFTNEFLKIENSINRLDQLLTCMINNKHKMDQNSTDEEIIDFYHQILELCKKDKEKVKECMDDFVKDDLELQLQLFADERLENENLFGQS